MRRRIPFFAIIVAAILLVANSFVCAIWRLFFGMPGWPEWQLVFALPALAFVPVTILSLRRSGLWVQILYAICSVWVGFLNFFFFAAVLCCIVDGTSRLAGHPFERPLTAAILFGLAFLTACFGLINAARIRVTRLTISLPALPEAWSGRTVALVTDLHLGRLSGPGRLRHVLSLLRRLQPDAVLIGGDMFDGTETGLNRLAALWRGFSAPQGIYYVTGNHEEFSDRTKYINAVSRTGIRVLNNEKITVEGLQIVGIHDGETRNPDNVQAILRQSGLDRHQAGILLAHRPENMPVAEGEGISLQLSGHTHGGQFWPWSMVVSRIYGRFAYGLNRLGSLQVYTSSGAGAWGPPLRVGTKSEIVAIRLQGEMHSL